MRTLRMVGPVIAFIFFAQQALATVEQAPAATPPARRFSFRAVHHSGGHSYFPDSFDAIDRQRNEGRDAGSRDYFVPSTFRLPGCDSGRHFRGRKRGERQKANVQRATGPDPLHEFALRERVFGAAGWIEFVGGRG